MLDLHTINLFSQGDFFMSDDNRSSIVLTSVFGFYAHDQAIFLIIIVVIRLG